MTDQSHTTFRSRRKRLPVLVLTAAMQGRAFQTDRDEAARRRDMQAVHRIEAQAKAVRLGHLRRK